MRFKQLIADEDAVSPVIGVILMVAITVILAAVIGTFVLGLGDNLQQTSPTATFNYDFAANNAEVTITHDGGDAIDTTSDTLKVVDEDGNEVPFPQDTVSAGDSVTFTDVSSGEEIRVVWVSENGDNSATLARQKAA